MFTLLTFMLRYSLYRTKPNIITLIALPSLTDFGRFLISDVFSWIRIFTYIISATMKVIYFPGVFFQWLISHAGTCGCFRSSERFHNFFYHLRVSIALGSWPLNLPKWQWRCHVSLHVGVFFYSSRLLSLLIIFLCQHYFFYLSWFSLARSASLVLLDSVGVVTFT